MPMQPDTNTLRSFFTWLESLGLWQALGVSVLILIPSILALIGVLAGIERLAYGVASWASEQKRRPVQVRVIPESDSSPDFEETLYV